MPLNAVYVGRPAIWGNPFTISSAIATGYAKGEADARRLVVECFSSWIQGASEWDFADGEHKKLVMREALEELRGKDLACWCPLDQPCHADVLLEIANRPEAD